MDYNNIPDATFFRHTTPIQIRFSDVDVLGHVNNTKYFTFFDTGKAYYMEAVLGHKVDWHHVDTVVANVDCAFLSPVFFGEEIELLTACEQIHEKSYSILQLLREKNTGQAKALCRSIMVAFDQSKGKACEVSDELRKKLCSYEGQEL